jgi:hypothetical protein
MGTWVLGGIGAALLQLIEEFHHSLNSTAQGLVGFSVLTLGVGVNLLDI